jgi:ribosomal protein L1
MKLHHFITTEVSAKGSRIRELGKALAPVAPPPAPVTEVKLADIKKIEPAKKTVEVKADGDLTQQIRDYAVDQMEHSPISSHLHRKIRHYD